MRENIHFVDHHRHSVLAMLGLGAVDPYGRCIVDHDSVCWCCCRGSGHGHKAGVETYCAWGVQGEGLARLGKGGLSDGMVGGRELELHHVADFGLNVVG
jgi:hypothetical protein